ALGAVGGPAFLLRILVHRDCRTARRVRSHDPARLAQSARLAPPLGPRRRRADVQLGVRRRLRRPRYGKDARNRAASTVRGCESPAAARSAATALSSTPRAAVVSPVSSSALASTSCASPTNALRDAVAESRADTSRASRA